MDRQEIRWISLQTLRRLGKAYHPRGNKYAGRGHIKNRVSIDERPAIVDEKSRVGDWEIDLVIGKGHSGALVTIVERQKKFTVSTRINDKSAETVTAATIALSTPLKNAVLTITADNGKEFLTMRKWLKRLRPRSILLTLTAHRQLHPALLCIHAVVAARLK